MISDWTALREVYSSIAVVVGDFPACLVSGKKVCILLQLGLIFELK
jgi:hypothetical protein